MREVPVKYVGYSTHVCDRRLLILRCEASALPPLYGDVVDRRLRRIGVIVDIFGPVKAPCAAVLCRDTCQVPAGEKMYTR